MAKRLIYWLVIIAILVAATVVRLVDPDVIVRMRHIAFDGLQKISPRVPDRSYPVQIIDIDERSMSQVGPWPWRREKLAQLVNRLKGLGARVVAFDFVFPNEQSSTVCELPSSLLSRPDVADWYKTISAAADGDKLFASSFSDARVVLGVIGRQGDKAHSKFSPRASFAVLGTDPARHIPTFTGATTNHRKLDAAAQG